MALQDLDNEPASYLLIATAIVAVVFTLVFFLLKRIGKNPRNMLPRNFAKRIRIPLFILFLSILFKVIKWDLEGLENMISALRVIGTLGIIWSLTWMLIVLIKIFKKRVLKRYDVSVSDNLRARKVYTQFIILENIAVFIVILLALGIALMSFNGIRQVGVSLLTSAGIAGIVLGFAAQKVLGTLLAGIQIAITQPIRIDDVVIIDGEWGWIEEIALAFVVVRIWDKRRLIVPSTYFIENTFQNWTRATSDIVGTVFLYTDYNIPIDNLRKELTKLVANSPYWDGKVNALQVTNASEKTMELRALMSANNSSDAWELRVHIREKLIQFIQENFPDSFPKSRIQLEPTA